ncbi:MAG: hypothetical protein SPF51_07535 [Candidatus Fimivicinus sp.]|nr:hypothetical protein [Oscillospiraceae bacterium]MDY5591380.1 hypothetical protein [Candidatus Fimivicinus sp.]
MKRRCWFHRRRRGKEEHPAAETIRRTRNLRIHQKRMKDAILRVAEKEMLSCLIV